MAMLLAIVLFLAVALVVFSFGAGAYAPSSMLGSRLRALGWQKAEPQEKPAFKERLEQALDPLSRALPLSPREVSRTRAWLIQAGYRDARHLTMYVGSRVLLAFMGLTVVIAAAGFKSLILMASITAFCFFLPRFVLKRMIRDRQRRITLALPDALDLTVICVEAGLALDQALMRVGEDLHHAHPDLSDEFYLVNLEMRAGKPRVEALRNLIERTGVDDVRALVGTLVQTVHSDSLRTERRQRAEEQAAKTTIKMIIPLVVFVLPSIIFVTLGPAVIELVRTLMPEMRR
ncbi:MAG: type II secretion system F family protein [Acidobacteria bacterium]|nr:MAG: type II secretion system F family protein [Acidobacteriota bacterium]